MDAFEVPELPLPTLEDDVVRIGRNCGMNEGVKRVAAQIVTSLDRSVGGPSDGGRYTDEA